MSQVETVREKLSGGRIQGLVIRAHVQWVREYFGDRNLTRVLSALPPHAAIEAKDANDGDWCRFETLVLLSRAIADVCGGREAQIPRELGRYTAHVAIGDRRHALRLEEIHRFCRCSVIRDALLQDRGECTYDELSEFAGRIAIRSSRVLSPIFCLVLAGYYEQIVAAHGGRDVEVLESSCQCAGDAACTLELRWR